MSVRFPGVRCAACGREDIIAIKPGNDPVYGPLSPAARGTKVVGAMVAPGRPDVAFCWKCWPHRPRQADLFARPIVPHE